VNVPNITYQLYVNGAWKDADSDLCVTGLSANTQYRVRAVTDGWTSDEQTVTTESEVQLPNNGMETWYSEDGPSKIIGPYYTIWYPRDSKDESSEGWCTMNSKTLQDGNLYAYNASPGTIRTDDSHSGYAAEIRTIAWGTGTTATGLSSSVIKNITPGELFLGTVKDMEPNYLYTFERRPSKITYWVKYAPRGSHKYQVVCELYDENKNLITTSYTYEEGEISSYEQRTITLNYDRPNVKAKYIRLSFNAGDNEKEDLKFSNSNKTPHYGNILYIDDINLIYE
jgi:hypothetical protein